MERRLALGTRVLGAAAFSVVAARIAWYFREPVSLYVQQRTVQEWKEGATGMLLVATLVLFFAVPAWLIVFRRAGIVVDAGGATVADFRHYGLFGRRRSFPVGDVDRVRAWRNAIVSKGRQTVYYQAALVLRDAREIFAVNDVDRERALTSARALARRLRVRLEDAS